MNVARRPTPSSAALPLLALFTVTACEQPERADLESPPALSEDRSTSPLAIASAQSMLVALDLPSLVSPAVVSLVSPHPEAALDVSNYGAISPSKGGSFVLLSTGRSGNFTSPAEPGTDFGATGPADDVVTFRFQVNAPHYLSYFSFDYTFLTAESPERIGGAPNDTFTVKVTDWLGERTVLSTSPNTSELSPATAAKVGTSPFHLLVDDPAGVDTVFGTGTIPDAATTATRRVIVPIRHGFMTIELDLRDLGDGILDTAVLVDNFAFSAVEVVDPQDDLLTSAGAVSQDPMLLATVEAPARGVSADGVTQVLLRSKSPGPGLVTFALTGSGAQEGHLSRNATPLQWGTSVTVPTVFVNGGHYAFALYRAPADFNHQSHAWSRRRVVGASWSYVAESGTGTFSHAFELDVFRPPVVVAPDLWSSCASWSEPGGLMYQGSDSEQRNALDVSCADYLLALAYGLADQVIMMRIAISHALSSHRINGVAATRVDVIGHGVGGLIARLRIDDSTYLTHANFFAGDINRLITVNTPHLGARMADEIVRFRDFTKQRDPVAWDNVRAQLRAHDIFLDPDAGHRVVDDFTTYSDLVNTLGHAGFFHDVAYHAIFSTGGKSIPWATAHSLLPSSIRALYSFMESLHPKVLNQQAIARRRLIFGTNSPIFCSTTVPEEDHDFFATAWEQQGGLFPPYTTPFNVSAANPNSHHFSVHKNQAHTQRFIELLNAPRAGGPFSSSIPPSNRVPPVNNCPMVIP